MDYGALDKEDFDAVVTGELTHLAIWLEDELNGIVTDYFVGDANRSGEFRRFLLLRDGLTAQDKLEVVRAMLPLFKLSEAELVDWKKILKGIEEFKRWRNAMAHGLDVTPDPYQKELVIEIVTRSGAGRQIKVTPAAHETLLRDTTALLERVRKARASLVGKV